MRSYVAIHMSLIFGVATLITGSIWAKGSWGHWWVWDEPTLVSFLIVFLLYATYQPLRFCDRGPRAPGALRVGVRDHGGSVRAAELHRRAPLDRVRASARAGRDLEPAVADGADVRRLAGGDRSAVHDAVQIRADGQAHARAAARPAPPGRAAGGRRRRRRAASAAPHRRCPPSQSAHAPEAGRRERRCWRAAGAAAARGGQVRGGRLHRAVRARARLRGDHGDPPQPHRARPRRAAGARRRPAAREGEREQEAGAR